MAFAKGKCQSRKDRGYLKRERIRFFFKLEAYYIIKYCKNIFASSCTVRRVKTVLPQLIHDDQNSFLKGRYIRQNIRLLYDTLLYASKHRIPGLLLMTDFEKAFDSVAWSFTEKSLTAFNF